MHSLRGSRELEYGAECSGRQETQAVRVSGCRGLGGGLAVFLWHWEALRDSVMCASGVLVRMPLEGAEMGRREPRWEAERLLWSFRGHLMTYEDGEQLSPGFSACRLLECLSGDLRICSVNTAVMSGLIARL